MRQKRVVIIGGGTGTSMVLKSLIDFPHHLSAVISTMDDGGSSGRLLTELGVHTAPGDIRLCLLALSKADPALRALLGYRFAEGDLMGHTVGNLLLAAAEKTFGDFAEGLKLVHTILEVQGEVIPVTLERTTLSVRHGVEQTVIRGEHVIDDCRALNRPRTFFLEPTAAANPKAMEAIKNADVLILGPGSISTSLIPVLIVEGVQEAIKESRAKIIFNANLTTTPGQNDRQTIWEMSQELESYLGKSIDVIVYQDQPFPPDLLASIEVGGAPTVLGQPLPEQHAEAIGADLLLKTVIKGMLGDPIIRKKIGHDTKRLGIILSDLIYRL